MTVMKIAGYCEKIQAPCENCSWDGSCTAEECTEGYLTEEEDDEGMMNECPGYEMSAGFIGGYCNVYDVHIGHGDDCPMDDEYEEKTNG